MAKRTARDTWLTVGEVAEHLKLTGDQVRRAIRRGDLPAIFFASRYLVKAGDVVDMSVHVFPADHDGDWFPRPKMAEPVISEGLPTESVIYFVQGGEGMTKIGRATDLRKRLRNLQSMCPVPLTLVHAIPDGLPSEGMLHTHFSAYRVYGEWFRLPDDWRRQVEVEQTIWAAHAETNEARYAA